MAAMQRIKVEAKIAAASPAQTVVAATEGSSRSWASVTQPYRHPGAPGSSLKPPAHAVNGSTPAAVVVQPAAAKCGTAQGDTVLAAARHPSAVEEGDASRCAGAAPTWTAQGGRGGSAAGAYDEVEAPAGRQQSTEAAQPRAGAAGSGAGAKTPGTPGSGGEQWGTRLGKVREETVGEVARAEAPAAPERAVAALAGELTRLGSGGGAYTTAMVRQDSSQRRKPATLLRYSSADNLENLRDWWEFPSVVTWGASPDAALRRGAARPTWSLPSVVTWLPLPPELDDDADAPHSPPPGLAAAAAPACPPPPQLEIPPGGFGAGGAGPGSGGWGAPSSGGSGRGRAGDPSLEDFELLKLVGRGGFGKVYQVRKRVTGRIMALKAMRKHLVIDELNVEGARNERDVLESVQHPFIVRLHCAFHDHGRLYLLMDWHNGGQLLALLEDHSPFSEGEARFYLAELVLAIAHLHAHGIVHRDLKPENVLLNSAGHVVVTDFGASKIAHDREGGGDIRTDSWVGTEMYMAPEQLRGEQYGRVVDWWAVGVLAWEMVTGSNPFYHSNPAQVASKVEKKKLMLPSHFSAGTHALLKGLLTRDPAKRLGKQGAHQVKEHAFFMRAKGFSWGNVLAMVHRPPFVMEDLQDELNTSRVNASYTSLPAVLSPVSPSLLALDHHSLFAGFEWTSPYYSPAVRCMATPWTPPAALDLNAPSDLSPAGPAPFSALRPAPSSPAESRDDTVPRGIPIPAPRVR